MSEDDETLPESGLEQRLAKLERNVSWLFFVAGFVIMLLCAMVCGSGRFSPP